MDTGEIIRSLLFRHDCVIIPGFGGLVAAYAPAQVHPTQHIFLPPHKSIAFNKSLHNNDGLLITEIANRENISYADATLQLQHFVRQIESSLKSKGSFMLPSIGKFYFDIEKNLQFKAEEHQNYLLPAFGLDQFIAHPVMRREEVISAIENSKINTKSKRRFNWIGLMVIIVLTALITQVFFVSSDNSGFQIQQTGIYTFVSQLFSPAKTNAPVTAPQHEKKEHRKDTLVQIVVIQNATQHAVDTAAIIANSIHPDSTVKVPVKTVEVSNPDVPKPSAPVESFAPDKYYVIFGCLKGKTASQKLIDQLNAKGITASIVINDAFYRIGNGGFNTLDEALESMRTYHQQGIKDVWVMKK